MSDGRLTREEIVAGLHDLVDDLIASGQSGTVRIVGGAAIWLGHSDHRRYTADIDAWLDPRGPILDAAARIGARRGYRDDWLNDAAAPFIPSGLGRAAGWMTVLDRDGVTVELADEWTLLAMKLQAVNRRGVRDMSDVVALIGKLELTSIEEVEDVYEQFFPGDALNGKGYFLIAEAFERGIPPVTAPGPLDDLT